MKLNLPNVALCCVTSVALDASAQALISSMRSINFGKVLLLSDQLPDKLPSGIEFEKIQRICNQADYSDFLLKKLDKFIYHSHVLIVQWDGYVIRPEAWVSDFLRYDYIGAEWPQFDDNYRVGNGGFSLRSKRLLSACADPRIEAGAAEDVVICRQYRSFLEKEYGLSFAPLEIAQSFSFERTPRSGREFGFHGVFNLIELLDEKEFCSVINGVESYLINFRDLRFLWRYSIRNRRVHSLVTLINKYIGKFFGYYFC